MKHIVEYILAYDHIVRIGIEAASTEEATAIAKAKFDDGTLWEDSEKFPVLYDDYEEQHDNTLAFRSIGQCPTGYPPSGVCVQQIRRDRAAHNAAWLLAGAVAQGKSNGGVINPSVLQQAYAEARIALGLPVEAVGK